MSILVKTVTTIEYEASLYPVAHWKRLNRFVTGEERDPRGLFRLADDKWDAWQYDSNALPTLAGNFRFHFGRFRTFIKLYVKWYCYYKLLGNAGKPLGILPSLPTRLVRADRYIGEHGFRSIDDISPSVIFQDLWDAQIRGTFVEEVLIPPRATSIQTQTRSFWQHIKLEFGVPNIVPPIAPYTKVRPSEFAADRSKVIPEHVIKKLSNNLALHRGGGKLLSSFDHLRLCVLMLAICLGRRINEILLSPRGTGSDGPVGRHPSKGGSSEGSLWFQFRPNKKGLADKVFVSPEWEDITLYCVREIVKYSDEIRHLAAREEQHLLILVSKSNRTHGSYHSRDPLVDNKAVINYPSRSARKGAAVDRAYLLKAVNFDRWLNGYEKRKGALELWGITADGSASGHAYRLLPIYTRHTRLSALALDPQVSLLARQRDLNHQDPDVQFAYQHRLRENNDALLEKIKEGSLIGRGVEWLSALLGIEIRTYSPQASLKSGCPSPMTPRMRALVRNNPMFLQHNRVPGGICTLPQGPDGCAEFLNCTSAGEGGCHSFAVDVSDVQMLRELSDKADKERQLHQESASAGRVVQAEKRSIQANRTENLRDEALRRASEETLIMLRRIQKEIEHEGI